MTLAEDDLQVMKMVGDEMLLEVEVQGASKGWHDNGEYGGDVGGRR